jgi:hypothetical protein
MIMHEMYPYWMKDRMVVLDGPKVWAFYQLLHGHIVAFWRVREKE